MDPRVLPLFTGAPGAVHADDARPSPAAGIVPSVTTPIVRPGTRPVGSALGWAPVHEIVGPLADRPGSEALYAEGAEFGAAQPTGTGLRLELRVPPFGAASFGTYFNAFPAAHWRHRVGADAVRLRLTVDRDATVAVHGSDAEGRARAMAALALAPFAVETVELDLSGFEDGGMLWFDVHAGVDEVTVLEGAWEVRAPVRHDGALVLGMPTVDRPGFVAANLRRLIEAPALLGRVAELVVVDQGERPLQDDPELAGLARRAGRVRVLRQPNLGGSGGFSRVMFEACGADAAFVTLLDDDIAVEPASLLRAFEFGRRTLAPAIVGGQMLDLSRPTVLHAGAERVERTRFWWGPAAPEHDRPDLATSTLRRTGWLHRRQDADYAGWWMCQIPIPVIERIGLALPLFLKWDDAEFGLRAAADGVPTVSLPGAAVWHVSWAEKDDMLEWPAFFHARNRLVAALLHGGDGAGVTAASRLLDLKHLLSMQYTTVALRHRAIEAVLAGPKRFVPVDAATVRGWAGGSDLVRHPAATAPDAPDAAVSRRAPAEHPTGRRFAVWTAVTTIRHLLQPVADRGVDARLSGERRRWWVLPASDSVLAPTADRTAYFWYRRDPARFRVGVLASIRLHRRLAAAWPRLSAAWRAEAPALASSLAWAERFARSADGAPTD